MPLEVVWRPTLTPFSVSISSSPCLRTYGQSGMYPNKWSVHDLGASYPVANRHNDGPMPVEECGNMLVMALSYAQKTGDKGVICATYPLLVRWTGYLVNDSLIPANQIFTDDFEGAPTKLTWPSKELLVFVPRVSMPPPVPAIICKSTLIQDY